MKLLKGILFLLIALFSGVAFLSMPDTFFEPIKPCNTGLHRRYLLISNNQNTGNSAAVSITTEAPENTKKPKTNKNKTKNKKQSKPKATPAPTPNTNEQKNFFIGNAPHKVLDTVNIDTLININNRLDKDFVPDNLVKISKYITDDTVKLNGDYLCANEEAVLAFCSMMDAAKQQGISGFYLRNAYRSYDSQISLWKKRLNQDSRYGRRYKQALGSAYPGSSEHQTGLALDITAVSSPEASNSFMYTPQYKWLKDNSYKYGFVLRYKASKTELTGIKFEPYHYRYIGKELAQLLYEQNICLEEYYNSPISWQ